MANGTDPAQDSWEVAGLQLMDAAVSARNPELRRQLVEQAQIEFGSKACVAILELANAGQLPAPGSPGFWEFIGLAAAGDVEIATVVLVRGHQWLPAGDGSRRWVADNSTGEQEHRQAAAAETPAAPVPLKDEITAVGLPGDTTPPLPFEVPERATGRGNPGGWQPGAWLTQEETPEDKAALAALPLHLGYPDGGNNPLALHGWDSRSVWGFDQQTDAYFAQLWRNGSSQDAPDIWIYGRGEIDGREYIVTTARLLAQEIAAAAGLSLPLVCAAMKDGRRNSASLSSGDIAGEESHQAPAPPPDPAPVSLKDEITAMGLLDDTTPPPPPATTPLTRVVTPPGAQLPWKPPVRRAADPAPRLAVEIIPTSLHGQNPRTHFGREWWDATRKAAYAAAGYRCEICGGRGPGHPVELHERYSYDEHARPPVQRATGLIVLCPACHAVKHLYRTSAVAAENHNPGILDEAYAHLQKVNGWTEQQLRNYLRQVRRDYQRREALGPWTADYSALSPR